MRVPNKRATKSLFRSRELEAIYAEEAAMESAGTDPDQGRLDDLQLRKWDAIHRYLHERPFRVAESLTRFEQWRRVRDHLKQCLDEPELTDWLVQQIDVAHNLAAGIHEMRPRKKGQCYDVLMEWVVNRRGKAEAVMRWVKGESRPDFPTVTGENPHPWRDL